MRTRPAGCRRMEDLRGQPAMHRFFVAFRSIGPKCRARRSEYGGMTPASELGIEVKGGIQLQGGFGVEMTKYFNSKECTCGEIN